ncbi:hypothetical protein BDR03DRAFT_909846 [Suillus americanus]|nr:hypothetical protein BDR03DRAFT_909846 [Suillus americanus]
MVDLGAVESTLLPRTATKQIKATPFLQLSGSFFSRRHDTVLGSELLFTETKNDSERITRSLRHVGVTVRRIRFKEVPLREKSPASAGNNSDNDAPVEDASDCTLGRMPAIDSMAELQARKHKKQRDSGKEKDMLVQEEEKDNGMMIVVDIIVEVCTSFIVSSYRRREVL